MGTENLQEKPFVSIIIPTWRDEKILNRCLDSLFGQDYPKDKYEIILISANKLDIKNENVKVIYGVNYANSRNAGAKIAKGEILAFVDDDCIVPKDWLSKGMRYFQNKNITILGGPALPFENEKISYRIGGYLLTSPFSAGFAISRYRALKHSREALEYSLITANNFVRKDIFEEMSGFNAIFSAEECDLYFRIKEAGYKLFYAPEIFVWHRAKPIFKPLIEKVFFYSSGRGILLAKKPQTIRFVYLIPSLSLSIFLGTLILSFFEKSVLPFLYAMLFIYFLGNLINAFYITLKYEHKLQVFFYSLVETPLMHLTYALGLLYGFYKNFSGKAEYGIKPKSKY